MVLLNDYELENELVMGLKLKIRGSLPSSDQRLHLSNAIVESIKSSLYMDTEAPGGLASCLYSVFPILISHYCHVYKNWNASAVTATNIDDLRRGVDSLRGYLRDCQMLQTRFDPGVHVDMELVMSDISFLVWHHGEIEQKSGVRVRRHLNRARQRSSTEPRSLHSLFRYMGNREPKDMESGDFISTVTGIGGNNINSDNNGFDGSLPPAGVPPEKGGNGGYGSFARHMAMKIDQIAYMTNILFSLTFIASIYGMNLDVFTEDGKVRLVQFLATAFPFTFGVFCITFVIPEIWRRWLGGSGGMDLL